MIASTRAVGCRLGSDPAAFTSNGLIATISTPTVPAIEPVPAHQAQDSGVCHRGQSSGSVGLGLKWSFVTHWPGQAALS